MAIIKGKWKWNDTIVQTEGVIEFPGVGVSFTSNGETFNSIDMCLIPGGEWVGYIGSSGPVWVYDSTGYQNGGAFQGWQNEAYKIIDFGNSDISVDDEFYKALVANATEYIEVPEEYNTKAINLNQLKRVYDNLNDKISTMSSGSATGLNLKNGEGACSLEQSFEEDGTIKGSNAYGKYSVALNQSNKAYQRNSFVTGLACEVGLTEEEFNATYPEGKDASGNSVGEYAKFNTNSNAGGQENKVKGRGSHIGGGYQNEVYGNYSGIVAGGNNTIEGTYSGAVAGNNHYVTGDNSGVLDGGNNVISGDNSGAGGVNNVVETDNTHTFGANLISNKRPDATMVGRYNNDKSYALFQVGSGWYNEETGVTHRRNSFEIFENGVNQFNEPTIFAAEVDFNKVPTVNGHKVMTADDFTYEGNVLTIKLS